MTEQEDTVICGRKYVTLNLKRKGIKPRFVVEGVNTVGPRKGKASKHSGGKVIRFKSLEKAERHILNMRLGV